MTSAELDLWNLSTFIVSLVEGYLVRIMILASTVLKLEDLKVLRRSPDLLNNCKTGKGQLQLIMKHILFYHIWGLQPFGPVT